MHNRHAWNEVTADGGRRFVEASKFGGEWSIRSKIGRGGEWTRHDPPEAGDLATLRDLLWNKYQRRRASYDDVRGIDTLLARLR